MITDLNPQLDRSSVEAYSNGLVAEFDKLYLSLYRDSRLESRAQAELAKQLRDYIRVTQVYPEVPPKDEEIPPR